MKLNGNFQNLQQSYLFVTIAKKVAESMDAYMKLCPPTTLPTPTPIFRCSPPRLLTFWPSRASNF